MRWDEIFRLKKEEGAEVNIIWQTTVSDDVDTGISYLQPFARLLALLNFHILVHLSKESEIKTFPKWRAFSSLIKCWLLTCYVEGWKSFIKLKYFIIQLPSCCEFKHSKLFITIRLLLFFWALYRFYSQLYIYACFQKRSVIPGDVSFIGENCLVGA